MEKPKNSGLLDPKLSCFNSKQLAKENITKLFFLSEF